MDDIAAVRLELSIFAAGKPKAVQNAVRYLDGWLEICAAAEVGSIGGDLATVNVLDCTARAVETLRLATGRA